ncbi:MAG: Spore Coat Protein domain [Bacteroidota bacterium]|jgi:hypothetical protein
MKKILFILLGAGAIQATFAATATTSFQINGTLANSCAASMSVANVSLGDLSVAQNGTTNLVVDCRAGTPYQMNVTSTNNWSLANGSSVLGYSLTYTGAASGVNTTWSGGAAGASVTSANQTGIGANQTYPLQVTNTVAAATLPSGTYSDTVSIDIVYS